jgi:hypothetical protein
VLNSLTDPLPERVLSDAHVTSQLILNDSVQEGIFIGHFQYLLESLRHVQLCLSIVKVNHVDHGTHDHSLLFAFKVASIELKSQISDEKCNSSQNLNRCTH